MAFKNLIAAGKKLAQKASDAATTAYDAAKTKTAEVVDKASPAVVEYAELAKTKTSQLADSARGTLGDAAQRVADSVRKK